MALPCIYTLNGKDYSYAEFLAYLHDGGLDKFVKDGVVRELPVVLSEKKIEKLINDSKDLSPDEQIERAKENLKNLFKGGRAHDIAGLTTEVVVHLTDMAIGYMRKGANAAKMFISDVREQFGDYLKDVKDEELGEIFNKAKEKHEKTLSGIKKALVSDEIIAKVNIDRISDKEFQELGKDLIATGEIKPREIIDEIVSGSHRALQPKEVVALIYHKTTLDRSLDKINQEIIDAHKNKEDAGELIAKRTALEKQIEDYDIMSVITASQQSLAFRLRKGLRDREFNLQHEINQYKANNNGTIPADVEAKFRKMADRLKEVDAEIEKERQARIKAEKDLAEYNINQELGIKQKQQSRFKLTEAEVKRKQELRKEFLGMFNDITNIPALLLNKKFIEYGKLVAKETAFDFAEFSKRAIDELGEKVKPILKDWYEKATETKVKEEPKKPKEPFYNSENKIVVPESFLKELIGKGIDKIEDWTTAAYDILKKENPDVTETEVRDAISGYGKRVNRTKNEIELKLQEQKSIGRLLSAYEDVTEKLQNPKRTGVQRRELIERERQLSKMIREAMKDLPQDEADIQSKWKSLLDKRKRQLENEIESLDRQIKEGRDERKNKSIEYDDATNDLIKKRDAKRKELDEKFPKEKEGMSPEERVNRAMGALEREISVLDDAIGSGKLDRIKRAIGKTPETPELAAKRAERDTKRAQLEEMRKQAGIIQKEYVQRLEKIRQRQIDELKERLKTGNFAKGRYDKAGNFIPAKPKQDIIPSDNLSKLEAEKIRLQEEFEKEQYKANLKNESFSQKARGFTAELFGLTRIIAGLDLSAIGVQGLIRTLTRPMQAARAIPESFKQLASEKRYEEFLSKVKTSDLYWKMKKSGGYLSEANHILAAREEAFNSGWVNHIYDFVGKYTAGLAGKRAFEAWKKANPYKATQRAFEGYINMMRLQAHEEYFNALEKEGYTIQNNPEAFKAASSWINNVTGRGKLVGKLDIAADLLTIGIFSPRKVAANFNVLNPRYYYKMYQRSPVMAKKAMKNMAQFVGVVGTTLLMYSAYKKASGEEGDVEWDPRSSHFLQMKTKDGKYIDILAGMGQVLALYGKLLSGEKKLSSGEIEELGKKFGSPTRVDVAEEFFEGKAAPTVGEIIRLAESKVNDKGQRISKYGEEMTPQSEIVKLSLPIWMQGITELQKEGDPLVNTGLQFMSILGINVRTPKEPKKESAPSKPAHPQRSASGGHKQRK